MTSRLDRLFILLESGSSTVTRKAAAKQIGEVQRLHPHELHNLLSRLIVYIHSSNWDTRIAAATAVQAILEQVPQWNPKTAVAIKSEPESNGKETRFSFDKFNLELILDKGARLLGSEGKEFDVIENESSDQTEVLMKQRALLNEKLGFSTAKTLGLDFDDMVTLDDMAPLKQPKKENEPQKINVQDLINSNQASSSQSCTLGMSSREMNRAKRKARQNQLSRSNSVHEPELKKSKTEANGKSYFANEPIPDGLGAWIEATEWPLEAFCTKLFIDLFNVRWEIRHGSAVALRELMKTHISGGGRSVYMSDEEQTYAHNKWLEDVALRLLCVLALDRFGDYVSDQVVAPVRETCAQVLGTVLKEMTDEILVRETIGTLQKFVKGKDWEVRHGGILGFKYFVVVRDDLIGDYLPKIINNVLDGLLDAVDDVSSVSASTLIPIASHLPQKLSRQQVSEIVKMLWDLLLEQDELAAACNCYMGLLAAILSLPNASQWVEMEPMENLIPRLWPFLSHPSSSVRRSTLLTLKQLTQDINNTTSNSSNHANVAASNLQINFGVRNWTSALLQEALRHVYQRILIEHIEDIQNIVEDVWDNLVSKSDLATLLHAACPHVSLWMCLAMQPTRLAFDQNLMVYSKTKKSMGESIDCYQKFYLGGTETVSADLREKNAIRARFKACRMLGLLSQFLVLPAPNVVYSEGSESPMDCYAKLLHGYLASRSSLQKIISSMIIAFWAEKDQYVTIPEQLQSKLKASLTEFLYYDEIATMVTRLLQEASDFLASLKQYKVFLPQFENTNNMLTMDQIKELCTSATENMKFKFNLKTKVATLLEERRKSLNNSYTATSTEQTHLNLATQSNLAAAVARVKCLPEKLNPVVKPLMESIKREENEILQKFSAENLAFLMSQLVDRSPSPNVKIVTNLCALLKSDEEFTPVIRFSERPFSAFEQNCETENPFYGIITLQKQQSNKNITNGAGSCSAGRGRPVTVDIPIDDVPEVDDQTRKLNKIQRLGASFAVQSIFKFFGDSLPDKVPTIWQIIFDIVMKVDASDIESLKCQPIDCDSANNVMTALQVMEIAAPCFHEGLVIHLMKSLPKLCLLAQHPLKAIRYMAARCLATLSTINTQNVMTIVIEKVLPLLSQIENPINREGAIEAITCIVSKLQFKIVPYVVLLIVPILGRMSDQNKAVRLISTNCFATLIQLMPLDGASSNQESVSEELQERKLKDKEFLDYLFRPKSIPDYKVPVPINAELRTYQQAGINWLWFLNKYSLHGILCDDMGLGKTLQTICILSGDHQQRKTDGQANLPSLVICPPTLTGHWVYEINKFVTKQCLSPLQYYGLPNERERLRSQFKFHNLIVASYDIVRKDIDFFAKIHWNYCVLDEGHIIKNGKTKCSKAIKQLYANHRLILSGTPIQNNVLELWSLFDFLMPGFLGSEKQFQIRFSRPILASRDAKSSPKEQEAGCLAMESLHRQVLPFLLRRVKEDVLKDLPPKITQDLLCELSPLQEKLYEDFSKTHLDNDLRECLENMSETESVSKKTHVFQALRYLQNVCNHPKLVLKSHHPEYQNIMSDLAKNNTSLNDIEHSAKLPALKQLLLDCGIGTDDDMSVNQHRALVFCQLKAMLDIIEHDLLRKHLPSVSYMRLDGSVPANMRNEIVAKFNNDPSIDILLLTTQVGGLGLNLTGADTVIFVEHDYNPMKDLQAMDRAHRIGQKKVVNVYRLITRKSLEEKIMGLQKFKLLTANTVVSVNNQSMDTMGTEQLLDLFDLNENDKEGKNAQNKSGGSMKSILQSLPELWDPSQYTEEFDMTQFIEKMKK